VGALRIPAGEQFELGADVLCQTASPLGRRRTPSTTAGTLLTAIIAENVDRSGFDVIEEAKAVEQLVGEYGNLGDAAEHLRKSKPWVSQRRALLKLAPELQEKLRDGDLAIREARALACVPQAEQVRRWRAAADKRDSEDAGSKPAPAGDPADAAKTRLVTRALRKFDGEPTALALALRDYLGESGTRALASGLRKLLK
jgi:ParB family transcriptional regulator, chromosome partitioning protein